jgi:ElaB/YqjD/DUF883 family membrane-anchored ribosome-binding protein
MNASVAPPSSTVDELRATVSQAERLIQTLGESGDEAIAKLRARAQQAVSTAKDRLRTMQGKTRDAVIDAANAADDYVHENPWQTIAVGVIFGMFVGALISRRI